MRISTLSASLIVVVMKETFSFISQEIDMICTHFLITHCIAYNICVNDGSKSIIILTSDRNANFDLDLPL